MKLLYLIMNINNHRKFKQNWTNNKEYVDKMPYVFERVLKNYLYIVNIILRLKYFSFDLSYWWTAAMWKSSHIFDKKKQNKIIFKKSQHNIYEYVGLSLYFYKKCPKKKIF